ncbi:MAG: integrase core domain-containing protein [Actinomycetota bacterium]|nr:integrase core domain-containing protein [Actinomycetota bacterium]
MLRAQPLQPGTIAELQALIDVFVDEYNHRRPHRSLPHRATPATLYDTLPKALPAGSRDPDTHDRIRYDRVDKAGSVTLRPQRPTPPHRHRPNPRRNLRHPAGPGPPDPGRERTHRRTLEGPDPQPQPRLPTHRSTQRPHPKMTNSRDPNAGPAVSDVLRHHNGRADRI